ncbi:DUF2975 domain-containing protein [Quatrionicoccus australiensis]|uniref:DUF2975 domain-containing protein n=1 Tax=Quatrionicoccus australiensis TaxID=138118 RepID=UPI001CF866E1|nr:DUF2975 domain-containing protein [Quatrionicoccus australiensis]UCV16692.1 DUF2975 domain-containing protein [Quatrionicoccus australiensis]
MTHLTLPLAPSDLPKLARRLASGCLLAIVVLPLSVVLYWMLSDTGTLAVRTNLAPDVVQGELQTWQRLLGCLLMEVPLCLLLVGVWQARKCFLLFGAGRVFSGEAIRYLRNFAAWSVASAIAKIFCDAAASVVVTLANTPGQRMLALGLGSDQLFLLFFAALVWLMAGVIGEGLALADENASFV